MKIDTANITASYDEDSDVLYISFGTPKPCVRNEIAEGVVVGVHNDVLSGITFIGFKEMV